MRPRRGAEPLRREHARALARRWVCAAAAAAAADVVEAPVGARAEAGDLGVTDMVGEGGRGVAGEEDGAACGHEVGVDLEAELGGEGEEVGRWGGRGFMGSPGSCSGSCDRGVAGRLNWPVPHLDLGCPVGEWSVVG